MQLCRINIRTQRHVNRVDSRATVNGHTEDALQRREVGIVTGMESYKSNQYELNKGIVRTFPHN